MKIFLDTEFTDLLDPVLISMGMVSEHSVVDPDLIGQDCSDNFTEEFYIEIPYPSNQCTPFVREAVLPLLSREPNSFCALPDVRLRMLQWLQIVRPKNEDIELCIDYQTDWDLFCDALDYQVPPWVHRKMVAQEINELLFQDFFEKSGLPQHHALYDARANKYAYRERKQS